MSWILTAMPFLGDLMASELRMLRCSSSMILCRPGGGSSDRAPHSRRKAPAERLERRRGSWPRESFKRMVSLDGYDGYGGYDSFGLWVRNGLRVAVSYGMLWMFIPPNMILKGFDPKIGGHGDIHSKLMPQNKSSAAPKNMAISLVVHNSGLDSWQVSTTQSQTFDHSKSDCLSRCPRYIEIPKHQKRTVSMAIPGS